MKLGGKGVCTVLSGTLLFVCALSQVVVGLRCVSLGSSVRGHFSLGAAAGAFYSGMLVLLGQLLLGSALLCCAQKPACRNLFLLGVVVFLLGVLTAFSGAVVDGDTASVVGRKYSHYCLHAVMVKPACEQLRDYHRSLVISTVLGTLECVLGLVSLVVIQRYQSAQFSRSRQCRRLDPRDPDRDLDLDLERDRDPCCSVDFQPVSYINLGLFNALEETGSEVQRGGHPSIELPGYSSADLEPDRCFPFSYPLSSELPPAYEDIFPAEACTTKRLLLL